MMYTNFSQVSGTKVGEVPIFYLAIPRFDIHTDGRPLSIHSSCLSLMAEIC